MSKLARKGSFREWIPLINTVIAVLGFLVVIVQLSMGLSQLENARRSERAQYLAGLHERAFGSPGIRKVFRQVEYGELKFDASFHKSAEQENLVTLLSFFELVGQLEELGTIEMDEIRLIFGYYLSRTCRNETVRRYIQFLRGSGRLGFHQFERLGLVATADAAPKVSSCAG